MNYKKIGVVGAGSWGTALAILLSEHGVPVTLWGHNEDHIAALKADHENKTYLPGVALAANIHPTASLSDVAGADMILIVTPSRATREVMEKLAGTAPSSGAVFLSCTKGIEQGSGLRMSEIIAASFPNNHVAVLSGPSHAEEVSRKMPTAVVVGAGGEAIGAIGGGILREAGQQRGLRETEITTGAAEVAKACSACADEVAAEGGAVDVLGEDVGFGFVEFELLGAKCLDGFVEPSVALVLAQTGDLHGEGACAALGAEGTDIFVDCAGGGIPIDAVMGFEAAVFDGDDGFFEPGGDLFGLQREKPGVVLAHKCRELDTVAVFDDRGTAREFGSGEGDGADGNLVREHEGSKEAD